MCLGLYHFQFSLVGQPVVVFSDNTTALSYVCKQGATFSTVFNAEAQLLLRWAEDWLITIVPQFVMGARNVVSDFISRRNQIIGSEWTLVQEVVDELIATWPATINLFATSLNCRLPIYFAPLNDPLSAGTDAFLQSWNGMQAYAFPPFSLIREVLSKLRQSKSTYPMLIAPLWPQKERYPDPL